MVPLILIQLSSQQPGAIIARRETTGYDAVGSRSPDARNPGL